MPTSHDILNEFYDAKESEELLIAFINKHKVIEKLQSLRQHGKSKEWAERESHPRQQHIRGRARRFLSRLAPLLAHYFLFLYTYIF